MLGYDAHGRPICWSCRGVMVRDKSFDRGVGFMRRIAFRCPDCDEIGELFPAMSRDDGGGERRSA